MNLNFQEKTWELVFDFFCAVFMPTSNHNDAAACQNSTSSSVYGHQPKILQEFFAALKQINARSGLLPVMALNENIP